MFRSERDNLHNRWRSNKAKTPLAAKHNYWRTYEKFLQQNYPKLKQDTEKIIYWISALLQKLLSSFSFHDNAISCRKRIIKQQWLNIRW